VKPYASADCAEGIHWKNMRVVLSNFGYVSCNVHGINRTWST